MIEVVLAYENEDVKVSVPAVPRVGDGVFRDDGDRPEYVVKAVQWYWDMTGRTTGALSIFVFVDEGRIPI